MGFQIVAISGEDAARLKAGAGKSRLSYLLLSDASMSAAKAFGIAYRVDARVAETYRGYGVELPSIEGIPHLPVPSVFLIRTDGTVAFSYANPDYRVRLQPDVLMAAANAEKARPADPPR